MKIKKIWFKYIVLACFVCFGIWKIADFLIPLIKGLHIVSRDMKFLCVGLGIGAVLGAIAFYVACIFRLLKRLS